MTGAIVSLIVLTSLLGSFDIKTIAEFDRPIAKAVFDQNTGELKEVILGQDLPTAILFYKNGKLIKRIDIPPAGIVRFFHSHSGNYVAVERVYGERQEAEPPILTGGGEFVLYNSEGKVVWKKNIVLGKYDFESPIPQVTLSDSGEFIVWGSGELAHYDLEGNKRDISEGCSDANWVRVSEDGRFFIVSHTCDGVPTLSLYHHSGQLKWRAPPPDQLDIHGIWISPHGKYVIGVSFQWDTFYEGKNVKELPEEVRRKLLSKMRKTKLIKEGKITMRFFRVDFAFDSTGQVLWVKKDSEYPSMAPQNPYAVHFDENEDYFAQSTSKPKGPEKKGSTRLLICRTATGEVFSSIPFSQRYWLKLAKFENNKVAFFLRKGITGPFFYEIHDLKGALIFKEELPPGFIPCYISHDLMTVKGVDIEKNGVCEVLRR